MSKSNYVYTATLLDKNEKEWPISLTIPADNFSNDEEFIPYAADDILKRAGGFKKVVKWEMKKITNLQSWEDTEYAEKKEEEWNKKWEMPIAYVKEDENETSTSTNSDASHSR